jgi:hypothetical protein
MSHITKRTVVVLGQSVVTVAAAVAALLFAVVVVAAALLLLLLLLLQSLQESRSVAQHTQCCDDKLTTRAWKPKLRQCRTPLWEYLASVAWLWSTDCEGSLLRVGVALALVLALVLVLVALRWLIAVQRQAAAATTVLGGDRAARRARGIVCSMRTALFSFCFCSCLHTFHLLIRTRINRHDSPPPEFFTHVCVCVCVYVCVSAHQMAFVSCTGATALRAVATCAANTHRQTCAHARTRIQAGGHTRMRAHVLVYARTHRHTDTHTHTHIRTHVRAQRILLLPERQRTHRWRQHRRFQVSGHNVDASRPQPGSEPEQPASQRQGPHAHKLTNYSSTTRVPTHSRPIQPARAGQATRSASSAWLRVARQRQRELVTEPTLVCATSTRDASWCSGAAATKTSSCLRAAVGCVCGDVLSTALLRRSSKSLLVRAAHCDGLPTPLLRH